VVTSCSLAPLVFTFNIETLLECFRGVLGTIVIILFIYSMLSTILIIILLWIIKNQFNKNKGVEE